MQKQQNQAQSPHQCPDGKHKDTTVTIPMYSQAELSPHPHWHDPLTAGGKNNSTAPSLRDTQVQNTDGIATYR